MDDNSMGNPWSFDATVNDVQNLVSVPFEVWRPTGLHVEVNDVPLSEEETRQLEVDIKKLIEAELNAETGQPDDMDQPISISLAGLGLDAERTARLSQTIEARVREALAKNPEAESHPGLDEEV